MYELKHTKTRLKDLQIRISVRGAYLLNKFKEINLMKKIKVVKSRKRNLIPLIILVIAINVTEHDLVLKNERSL